MVQLSSYSIHRCYIMDSHLSSALLCKCSEALMLCLFYRCQCFEDSQTTPPSHAKVCRWKWAWNLSFCTAEGRGDGGWSLVGRPLLSPPTLPSHTNTKCWWLRTFSGVDVLDLKRCPLPLPHTFSISNTWSGLDTKKKFPFLKISQIITIKMASNIELNVIFWSVNYNFKMYNFKTKQLYRKKNMMLMFLISWHLHALQSHLVD